MRKSWHELALRLLGVPSWQAEDLSPEVPDLQAYLRFFYEGQALSYTIRLSSSSAKYDMQAFHLRVTLRQGGCQHIPSAPGKERTLSNHCKHTFAKCKAGCSIQEIWWSVQHRPCPQRTYRPFPNVLYTEWPSIPVCLRLRGFQRCVTFSSKIRKIPGRPGWVGHSADRKGSSITAYFEKKYMHPCLWTLYTNTCSCAPHGLGAQMSHLGKQSAQDSCPEHCESLRTPRWIQSDLGKDRLRGRPSRSPQTDAAVSLRRSLWACRRKPTWWTELKVFMKPYAGILGNRKNIERQKAFLSFCFHFGICCWTTLVYNPLGMYSVLVTMPMAEPKCEIRLIVNHRCSARGWAGPREGGKWHQLSSQQWHALCWHHDLTIVQIGSTPHKVWKPSTEEIPGREEEKAVELGRWTGSDFRGGHSTSLSLSHLLRQEAVLVVGQLTSNRFLWATTDAQVVLILKLI